MVERVKRARLTLCCPRCGCGTYLTVRNGATHDGKNLAHGTLIDKLLCENCYKQGIKQSLLPELKRIE